MLIMCELMWCDMFLICKQGKASSSKIEATHAILKTLNANWSVELSIYHRMLSGIFSGTVATVSLRSITTDL